MIKILNKQYKNLFRLLKWIWRIKARKKILNFQWISSNKIICEVVIYNESQNQKNQESKIKWVIWLTLSNKIFLLFNIFSFYFNFLSFLLDLIFQFFFLLWYFWCNIISFTDKRFINTSLTFLWKILIIFNKPWLLLMI